MELLEQFVGAFAQGIELADAKRPQASSTKRTYQPGIGPHKEPDTVEMVLEEIASNHILKIETEQNVKYPNFPRNKCDLLLRSRLESLYVEVKMIRFLEIMANPTT